MHETDEDLEHLTAILESSRAKSGDHLRSAFAQDNPPSAADLIQSLSGIFEMHLAVLSRTGDPLVAPVDGIFYRGRVWAGFPEASLRSKLLRADQRVSASYNSEAIAFIVHGTFVEVPDDDAAGFRDTARSLYIAAYGDWFGDYFDNKQNTETRSLTGYIEPRVMFAKVST